MLAYKTKLNISSEAFFFKIPSNFKGKNVEIIVLEEQELNDNYHVESISDNDNNSHLTQTEPNDFQKILLSSPTWSENDYQTFLNTRNLFNTWKID